MKSDIQIVSKHLISPHNSTQLRCNQPAEYMRSLGYSVDVGCIYRSVPRAKKLIVLHRVMADAYTKDFVLNAKLAGCRILYDADDLIFTPDGGDYLKRIGKKGVSGNVHNYAEAMAYSDAVSVSTEFLAEQARQYHPSVSVVRNALSSDYLKKARCVFDHRQKCKSEFITIGYLSGTGTHCRDFKIVEASLLNLLKTYRNIRVLLVGPLTFSKEFHSFGPRFEHRDFVPYDEFTELFCEIDINLVPLEVSEAFCHAKSELKFIEAGACGVPSIASPTETHQAVIQDGKNGRLANDEEWLDVLCELVHDESQRRSLGSTVRALVLDEYSPEQRSTEWKELIDRLLKEPTTKRRFIPRSFLRGKLEFRRSWRAAKRLKLRANRRFKRLLGSIAFPTQ